jgi:hypothetical protein
MGFNREHIGQSTINLNGGFMGESWENHGNIFYELGNQINMFNSYVK